jgi:fumarylacetoacetase
MDPTTDPNLRSWIAVEPDSHFSIQNLPYGVFRPPSGGSARVGVAIGEMVLDLEVLEASGYFNGPALAGRRVFGQSTLNTFMALGRRAWREARETIVNLLRADAPKLRDNMPLRSRVLFPQSRVELMMPVSIGDYTDFYSSREHATNVGTLLRGPDHALMPNWLHLPVAYHARASSVVVSGTDVHRPRGQTRQADAAAPTFGPSQRLDFELEVGVFVGPGNRLGEPIPIGRAAEHVFGMVLVNDWSARDLQAWEYQPLGPFLGKNFLTSISPWVVTLDALEPFRVAGPTQDPQPLPYLRSEGDWAYDIHLEVRLHGADLPEPHRICTTNFKHLYWNICQQVAHHTVNGCNLRAGDLLASGTISGPEPASRGSLIELAWNGQEPLRFPNGQTRAWLHDGDRVTLTGWCQGEGYRVGLGEVTGCVLPAIE